MLDAAAPLEDRIPDIGRVLALLVENLLEIGVLDDERARQRLVRVDVGRDRFDAGAGPAADDADRRGRRNRHLAAETFHRAGFGSVGARPAFLRQHQRGFFRLGADMLEHLEVPHLGHRAFEADALGLEEGVEAHHAEAHAAFAHGRIFRACHLVGRPVDIVLQDVVEEAHDVLDELLVAVPFVPFLEIERGQAAHCSAIVAEMVDAGRQCDFGAQVRGRDLEPQFAVMLGHHAVHRVGEHDVGLARSEPGFDQLLEQAARVDGLAHRSVTRGHEVEFLARAHRFHEGIGDEHAVVQVQRLAVEIAARLADL